LGVLDLVRQGGAELETDPVQWKEISEFPMIVPLDAIRGYSQSNPAPLAGLNVRIETAARPLMIPLVLAGEGATIMERGHADQAALAGAVVAELAPPLSFPLWILHRKTQLTPAAEAFCQLT
jgi:hypothetical protein